MQPSSLAAHSAGLSRRPDDNRGRTRCRMFIQVNQLRAAGVSSSSTMMATSAMTCKGMTTIRIFFSRSARNTWRQEGWRAITSVRGM